MAYVPQYKAVPLAHSFIVSFFSSFLFSVFGRNALAYYNPQTQNTGVYEALILLFVLLSFSPEHDNVLNLLKNIQWKQLLCRQ